jgi:hypothetical protein
VVGTVVMEGKKELSWESVENFLWMQKTCGGSLCLRCLAWRDPSTHVAPSPTLKLGRESGELHAHHHGGKLLPGASAQIFTFNRACIYDMELECMGLQEMPDMLEIYREHLVFCCPLKELQLP